MSAPAFAIRGQVYLRKTIPESKRGMVMSHEITHVMKQLGFQPYIDFIKRTPDMLNLSDPAALAMLEQVAKHQKTTFEEADPLRLYDEFNATMYGHIASGKTELFTDGDGSAAFRDFAAYAAELTELHKCFKCEARLREELHRAVDRVYQGEADTMAEGAGTDVTAEESQFAIEEQSLQKDRKDSKMGAEEVAAGTRRGTRKRPRLSKQEWRQVQSAQMQKYAGVDEADIPESGYIFAHDKFYLIRNYGLGAFEVTARLDPATQQRIINAYLEGKGYGNDGQFSSTFGKDDG